MRYLKIELILNDKEVLQFFRILRLGQREEDVEMVGRIVHLIDEAQRKNEYEEERNGK